MYKLNRNDRTGETTSVTKNDRSGLILCIPFDPANTDYQEYLKWLAEGNTPEPPDEPNL